MESIADRVDLVKRASEATIEITRQLGAELALAQGEIRHLQEDLTKANALVQSLREELAASRASGGVLSTGPT